MGGHNPLIVVSDADLDRAVAAAYAGASGWGPREQGRAAMEFYTESVTVYAQ
jgi:acyl-CoA reductase-like NAD-dependent aldehyde dehydrogenase